MINPFKENLLTQANKVISCFWIWIAPWQATTKQTKITIKEQVTGWLIYEKCLLATIIQHMQNNVAPVFSDETHIESSAVRMQLCY